MKKIIHLFQKRKAAGTRPVAGKAAVAVKKKTARPNQSAPSSAASASHDPLRAMHPRDIYSDDGDLGYCQKPFAPGP